MPGEPGQVDALDVRVFVPIERHRMLLEMLKEPPVGESFVFIGDHDPRPACDGSGSIHDDVLGREYLQRRGIDWKVRVTRTEASRGREFTGLSMRMGLRRIEEKDPRHVIFQRYDVVHVTRKAGRSSPAAPVEVVREFYIRPCAPAERREPFSLECLEAVGDVREVKVARARA